MSYDISWFTNKNAPPPRLLLPAQQVPHSRCTPGRTPRQMRAPLRSRTGRSGGCQPRHRSRRVSWRQKDGVKSTAEQQNLLSYQIMMSGFLTTTIISEFKLGCFKKLVIWAEFTLCILDFEFWILDFEFWILDFVEKPRKLNRNFWI